MRKEVKIGMGVGLILICAASLYFFAKPQPDTADGVKIGLPQLREKAAGEADPTPAQTAASGLDPTERVVASPTQPRTDQQATFTSADVPVSGTMIAVPVESIPLPLAKDPAPAVTAGPAESPKIKMVSATPSASTAKLATKPPPATPEKSQPAVEVVPTTRYKSFHTVKIGESFYMIARDHYGDPSKHKLISVANPKIDPKAIPVGYRLILPAEKSKPAILPTSSSNRYTVRPGDTLIGIAQRLFGDQNHFKAIYEANRTQFPLGPDHLKSGLVLELPSYLRRVDTSTGS